LNELRKLEKAQNIPPHTNTIFYPRRGQKSGHPYP